MAWWTDIIFFKKNLGGMPEDNGSGDNIFVRLVSAVRKIIYDNFVDSLHVFLIVSTYTYLIANVLVFFYQNSLPANLVTLVSTFSEPYLGALGIYIVVNEIRKRRGRRVYAHFGNVFTFVWFAFLIVSTTLVYLDETYHFNYIYRTIVTNSFAAFIIRIGSILGRVP